MPRLSDEVRERRRRRRAAAPSPSLGDIGAAGLRYAERGARLGGLAVGTAAGLVGEAVPFLNRWTPDVYSGLGGAAGSFWENMRKGDWDAAITAYQDELDAGPGYWGASELAAELLIPGGLARTGVGLAARAPRIASGFAKFAPEAARPGVTSAAEAAIRGTGQALRVPWEVEEAIGRGLALPVKAGWRRFRGPGAAVEEVVDGPPGAVPSEEARVVDAEFLDVTPGAAPTAAPITPAARGVERGFSDARTGEAFSGEFFRGSGREVREDVFDPHFAQENIFGDAVYATPDEAFAKTYGPNLSVETIRLRNPLVITNDTEYRALTKEAGLFSNVPTSSKEVEALRSVILNKGHDGVVIRVPPSEQTGKVLQQAFGEDTVVDFGRTLAAPPTPTAVPAAAAPDVDDPIEAMHAGLRRKFGFYTQGDLNTSMMRKFVAENIRPVFLRQFGDAPAMTPQRFTAGEYAGEILLEISEVGWREKAVQGGLEYAGEAPYGAYYRIPGIAPVTPGAAPTAAPGPVTGARVAGVTQDAVTIEKHNEDLLSLAKKWQAAKARNSAQAMKNLDDLKAKGFDTDNAESALKEYKDTVRGDFDEVEEFAEARSEAWEKFVSTLDEIEPLEVADAEDVIGAGRVVDEVDELPEPEFVVRERERNARIAAAEQRRVNAETMRRQDAATTTAPAVPTAAPVTPALPAPTAAPGAPGAGAPIPPGGAPPGGRKKPPGDGGKRPSKGEAERGPDEISLDPMAGFEATPKLGWWSGKVNQITKISNWALGQTRRVRQEGVEGVIETAKRVRAQIISKAQSDGNTIRTFVRKGMRDNFTVDAKTGYILDDALKGRAKVTLESGVEVTLQSPTLQDIAARYDTYAPFLTDGQKAFIGTVRNILEDGTEWEAAGTRISMPGWNEVLRNNLMPEFDYKRVRGDITGSGFYITRGRVRFVDGTGVSSIGDEIDKLISIGKKPKQAQMTAEHKAKMPAMGKMIDADRKIVPYVDAKGRTLVYDSFEKTIDDYVKGVADRVTDVKVKAKVRDLAEQFPGTTRVTRAVIEGVDEVDDALAAAINRELGESSARKLLTLPIIRNINDLYRGIKANFDLSAIGIHGSLAMFRAPRQWGQATSMTFRSLAASMKGLRPGVPARGQEIVDEALALIDQEAKANGRLVSRIWANIGLRQGGTAVETALPGAERLLGQAGKPGVRGRVSGVVGGAFQLSNRLFGSFGDVLRLRWADELLRNELAKGKTLKEMSVSQAGKPSELQQIADSANRMTGWSDKQFGGDLGEVAMFAARFFQSRLETLGQSLVGVTRMRAPTREALGAIGRTRFNKPFRGQPLIESDVLSSMGRAQTIESREALQTMVRLIGWGVTATEMANAMLGNETDRRLFVDGKVNPNFYTIRMGGRDFSVFGPTIGLLRALGTVAADPSPQGLRDASRGLGSGVVRLAWDNITGYGFTGDPAPLGIARGIRGDDPRGFGADPMEILRYVAELALPIAPGAAGGEIIEGLQSVAEGDLERALGATAAIGAEIVGGRVARLSRSDEADELSQEMWGKRYEDLDISLKADIDDLVDEKMGEYGYRGPKGPIYKKRDDINTEFLTGLESAVRKFLTADITSVDWSARQGRQDYNKLRETRQINLYGMWDKEKQRTVGGVNEDLYDRDKPREEPELGTREHNVWRYYKTFEDALDEEGKMVWDEFDRLQSEFWASLKTVSEREEMLRNMRTREREYPEEMQKMIYAGRYAQGVELDIGGQLTTYWALREHPTLIRVISDQTGVTRDAVRKYLDLSYLERESARHDTGDARLIEKALDKAKGSKGILTQLQEQFIKESPNEWLFAMMEAGYTYRDSEDINNFMRDQIREGRTMPEIPYENLYKEQVVAQ